MGKRIEAEGMFGASVSGLGAHSLTCRIPSPLSMMTIRKEPAKTIGAVQMAKRPVGRHRKIKPTAPEGVIIPIPAGSEPTGLPPQTSETFPKGVTALVSKKPCGRPGKTGSNKDYT
ncbi:hypothetical protein XU18_0711 [Perkinsela sp. CCAP 1560/4]|nr:hypothetical protein XU18_0711 [Perkinsela sp. CCAP 1560/4]|eukprot:KNH08941.1 hypothetical protein XU18_0711 [Perkinsela sp. CCAP 1560/4]